MAEAKLLHESIDVSAHRTPPAAALNHGASQTDDAALATAVQEFAFGLMQSGLLRTMRVGVPSSDRPVRLAPVLAACPAPQKVASTAPAAAAGVAYLVALWTTARKMTADRCSTFLPPEKVNRRPNSIGKAIPNAEILVLPEDGIACGPVSRVNWCTAAPWWARATGAMRREPALATDHYRRAWAGVKRRYNCPSTLCFRAIPCAVMPKNFCTLLAAAPR